MLCISGKSPQVNDPVADAVADMMVIDETTAIDKRKDKQRKRKDKGRELVDQPQTAGKKRSGKLVITLTFNKTNWFSVADMEGAQSMAGPSVSVAESKSKKAKKGKIKVLLLCCRPLT